MTELWQPSEFIREHRPLVGDATKRSKPVPDLSPHAVKMADLKSVTLKYFEAEQAKSTLLKAHPEFASTLVSTDVATNSSRLLPTSQAYEAALRELTAMDQRPGQVCITGVSSELSADRSAEARVISQPTLYTLLGEPAKIAWGQSLAGGKGVSFELVLVTSHVKKQTEGKGPDRRSNDKEGKSSQNGTQFTISRLLDEAAGDLSHWPRSQSSTLTVLLSTPSRVTIATCRPVNERNPETPYPSDQHSLTTINTRRPENPC